MCGSCLVTQAKNPRNPRVLAIAIDAAEPELIRRLIDQDELPFLKSLLAQGHWRKVKSPAHIGSGAVWPTFISGVEPSAHGVYGEWSWQPETMSLRRYQGRGLVPFWKELADAGVIVGIFDLPFMPTVGLSQGFEVSEWGPHDRIAGHTSAGPEKIVRLVTGSPAHALSSDRLDSEGPHDRENLTKLASACLRGVELRGTLAARLIAETQPHLALVNFTEVHHAAHYLWHQQEPESAAYSDEKFRNPPPIDPSLRDIYREVDRQIGRLLETCTDETQVLVFSLHGMRPAHGIANFLAPLLVEKRFASPADWRGQNWGGRARSLLASAKRHAPAPLKKLYYQTLPATATQALARPTMLPAYDWTQTRAFSLPTDQHGWIRINLKGREAEGIVEAKQYDELCVELEQFLRTLTSAEGKTLVRNVVRTAANPAAALVQQIPDLIVHWDDAAFASPLRIRESSVEIEPEGMKFTGQHAPDGFCIVRGDSMPGPAGVIQASQFGCLISSVLLQSKQKP